jgi:pyrroline-5-carboxylate reductase
MTVNINRRFGMIGVGRMGSALARGFLAAKILSLDRMMASDIDRAALTLLQKETGIKTTTDNTLLTKSSDIILLALKPDRVRTVLEEIRGTLTADHLVVSIAAGIPIRLLEDLSGGKARIVRVMPNTPALIGQGAAAFSPGRQATREDIVAVRAMLESVGTAVELAEKHLDAVTGLSGSGPAYVFMVIEALADGGVKMGLPRSVAMELAAQTVAGAAKMVLETKKHPGELKDQVASPGGTTIAGISQLERGGLRAALIEAVEAATKRSVELGQNS